MLNPTPIELGIVVLIGAVLVVPLGGAFIRRISQLNHLEVSSLNGIPLKVAFPAIIAMLGLSAWIITPILSILVLIGAAKLLPFEGRMRASLLIIGCLSIGLGAALTAADLPFSQIAALKLLGSPFP